MSDGARDRREGGWPRRWDARWIWLFDEPPEPPWEQGAPRAHERESWVMLRRAFTLDAVPDDARCRVTADGRYVLWVNGLELGRGPARSEPAHLTYDEYALPLRRGDNAIAILARHYGRPVPWWIPAPFVGQLGHGGVLFESTVGIASDDAWRVARAPYVVAEGEIPSDGPPDAEVIEPAAFPVGWIDAGFDDAGWARATVLHPTTLGVTDPSPPTDPFGPLEPRPIPPLGARAFELGAADVLRAGETVVFDARGITTATIVVSSASAGALELTCGEDLTPDGAVVAEPRDWRMTVLGPGSVESFEPVGFRYLAVRARDADARDVRLTAVERIFPREPGARFRCSDPTLDAIWEAGVRTLDLCTTDSYLDCPGREQRAWLGDAYLHTSLRLVVDADTSMCKRMLRLHARGARADGFLPAVAAGDYGMRATTLPDHSLLWVLALGRYHAYTADADLVAELLPTAARILDAFERWRGPDDLIEHLPGWVFVDWAQLERGRTFAPVDAFLAMALDAHAVLCEAVGDDGSARRSRARADRTRAAFEAFWDPARAAYTDTIGGRRISQQTNALAIACDAAPAERWDAILARILDPARIRRTRTPGDPGTFAERIGAQYLPPDGFDDDEHVVEAQPFFCHFLHQALARAGRYGDILDSIMRWAPILERGDGCFGEYWDHTPGLGSRCHAWAATPTFDLTTHILGVRPVEPGAFVIEPHLGRLAWAEGMIPTPEGWLPARAETT